MRLGRYSSPPVLFVSVITMRWIFYRRGLLTRPPAIALAPPLYGFTMLIRWPCFSLLHQIGRVLPAVPLYWY